MLNFGNSCAATVLGSSPLFKRISSVEVVSAEHPELNKEESAPN
jgi:hypothetical protein